jgi:hypothetical protein
VLAGPLFLLLFCSLLLPGCAARLPVDRKDQVVVARTAPAAPLLAARAPSFLLQDTQAPHNRIGRVEATGKKGLESVGINTGTPVIYAESRLFSTGLGTYTNLVYRIHFPETPCSLVPFYLSAGKNVGLLVILTLDAQQRPLLLTTANTCGCYAASIPTELLPPALYPDDWPSSDQLSVFGEQLPARLKAVQDDETIQVLVRGDVHRVRDVRVIPKNTLLLGPVQQAEIAALESLKSLPLGDGTVTSFYYEHGPLKGHVKGAIKPWETLFLSLASLDLFIGMDKEFGDTQASGNPFFTSLKPWNRSASDLNDFAAYLRFNGWKL